MSETNRIKIGDYTYDLYLEHDSAEDKAAGKDNGNVTALYVDNGQFPCTTGNVGDMCYEAASGVFFYANSPCQSTSVSVSWLNECCTPIDEARARQIHPLLFTYLEAE